VWLDQCWQDIAYAWRTLRKSPGFTLTAAAVLGLGAGANLTTFQIFLVSVLQKPPVREADALLRLEPVSAFPRYAFYRESSPSKINLGSELLPLTPT
jgi:putative ABC transport system permease protein